MKRNALTNKILVLGIDGFEPRLAKKYMDEGKMPALKSFVEKGSCREDLVLLGAMPTVTPPLWTTLATGAYPGTHGITCFFNQDHENLDSMKYALDSRLCKAEPLWNVFAEVGKKTLVWHWPGSSWPPTSDSDNLAVVDGTQPAVINGGNAKVDIVKLVYASEKLKDVEFLPNAAQIAPGAGCIIDDVEALTDAPASNESIMKTAISKGHAGMGSIKNIILTEEDDEIHSLLSFAADTVKSPIKEPSGWSKEVPKAAKEFYIIVSKGTDRRPGLILKNEDGIYDTIELYMSKKAAEPYCTLKKDSIAFDVLDSVTDSNGNKIKANRSYHVMDLADDGSSLNLFINDALDIAKDDLWSPKALMKDIVENVGFVPARPSTTGANEQMVTKVILPTWDHYSQWQADSLRYLMDNEKYDIIFSHLHNVDGMGHQFWHYAKYQDDWNNNENNYQKYIEEAYMQTDRYIARFVEKLDEWTIIVTSDHGLITQERLGTVLGEPGGCTIPVMAELGYTVMVKDENGNDTKEIDWSKTTAVANRGNHIFINLKGRQATGIVEPKDKYELEEKLISDLYNYRDHKYGKRVVSIALRNKDAAILGMSGPECGDIIYFAEEGYNVIHADSLSTQYGYADTSVSPIFVGAGPGIKEGYITDRMIRQVDVAPTLAVLGGVRMPAQNEGSVLHNILTEEF